jgi:hypothetical protein
MNQPVDGHSGHPHQLRDLGNCQKPHFGKRGIPGGRLPRGSIVSSGHQGTVFRHVSRRQASPPADTIRTCLLNSSVTGGNNAMPSFRRQDAPSTNPSPDGVTGGDPRAKIRRRRRQQDPLGIARTAGEEDR